MKIIRFLSKSNQGSAISEFLIFTLPFFTIFLIFITAIQNKSVAVHEATNLARQVVRAFVTSPNEELARVRAFQVIDISKARVSQINLEISCNTYPCFKPGNQVTATISSGSNFKASATEYVDLWR
jgi:hypothetical protein